MYYFLNDVSQPTIVYMYCTAYMSMRSSFPYATNRTIIKIVQ